MLVNEPRYKALVVEDDGLVRQLTMRALAREGFVCNGARDGIDAAERLKEEHYDLVVVDLCMPNKNGHTLATEILADELRPAIVILTAVLEPRLAKDLAHRGVEGIAYKPVDYPTFAVNVKSVVVRHDHALREQHDAKRRSAPETETASPSAIAEQIDNYWKYAGDASESIEEFRSKSQDDPLADGDAENASKSGNGEPRPQTETTDPATASELDQREAKTEALKSENAVETVNREPQASVDDTRDDPSSPRRQRGDGKNGRHGRSRKRNAPRLNDNVATIISNACSTQRHATSKYRSIFHATAGLQLLLQSAWNRLGNRVITACLPVAASVCLGVLLVVHLQLSYRQSQAIQVLEQLGAKLSHSSNNELEVDLRGSDVSPLLDNLLLLGRLKALELAESTISDEDLAKLQEIKQLQSLGLDNTAVSDAGMRHLFPLRDLRELSLKGTSVTSSMIRELEQAIPGISIDHDAIQELTGTDENQR